MAAILVRFEWHGDYPGSEMAAPSYTVHSSPPTTDPCNKVVVRNAKPGDREGSKVAIGLGLQLTGRPALASPNGEEREMTNSTTEQMAGVLLDELV